VVLRCSARTAAPTAFPVTFRARFRTSIDPRTHSPTTGSPSPAEERDPDFLRRLRARDRTALGRFYELFFDRVYGYVRRMLGEDHLAEDVTQEVFVHIQRSIATYDPARELSPWVFAIATNKVRDHWRSRRHHDKLRETSFDADDADGEKGGRRPEPADGRRGPLLELVGSEMRATLNAAIDALPAGMRETLVLRWFEELSFEDIGRIIERNETAARKRYSRALEELRNALEKHVEARKDGGS
jgi:RNA polymerase sigma-70 factor, ECF subfamily